MNKLRVSFEIKTSWENEDYRLFIKKLKQNDSIELFMLTIETDQDKIDAAQAYLDLSSSNITQYADNTTKDAGIIANQIQIHFDNDAEFAEDLSNHTDPKIWGIYVARIYNRFELKMRYAYQFDIIVKYFINAETSC